MMSWFIYDISVRGLNTDITIFRDTWWLRLSPLPSPFPFPLNTNHDPFLLHQKLTPQLDFHNQSFHGQFSVSYIRRPHSYYTVV